MKEKWLKDIQDRMTDYEVDEPANLWNEISSRMPAQTELPSRQPLQQPRRKNVWLWTGRAASVAALLALIFTIGLHNRKADKLPSQQVATSQINTEDAIPENNLPYAAIETYTIVQNQTPAVNRQTAAPKNTVGIIENETYEETASSEPQEPASTPESVSRPQEETPVQTPVQVINPRSLAQVTTRSSKSDRISLGVLTSGVNPSSRNSRYIGETSIISIGSDNSEWEDYPMLGMMVFNQGQEVDIDIEHRQPVRVGVTFAYRIGDRLAIESGLTYTNLTSDIREGSTNNYFKDRQTLHYVGIPLSLEYRIFSTSVFDFYVTPGVTAEKSVSGERDRTYVFNGQTNQKQSEKIAEKPLQWSANASLGLQYDFGRSISIYAEPGISYYFDDNTSLETIYKEKPLNFSLSVGLKFSFWGK